jgi:3-deoxy-D-manno-octulosonic-acid transferase
MLRSPSLFYRALIAGGRHLVPAFGAVNEKARVGHAARKGVSARLAQWARSSRDPARPLVWLHAPSVGEGLQAEPVLRRLRARHPSWQFAYTYFSPSAVRFAERLGADVADYLPYDTLAEARNAVKALQPAALVFSKLDLWPQLATHAAERGTAVGLIAATVRPGSGRLRWPARTLLAPGYRAVSRAGAIAPEDAGRLVRLGVDPDRIEVVGDTRYDSVTERVAAVPPDHPLLRLAAGGGPALVAGSTWPPDEIALLRAFSRVLATRPEARLVLVPHEPTPVHLAGAERTAERLGLPAPVRLSAASGPVPFLLVDRVGVLAAIYGAGALAWVGGGFGSAGLHSVLEPAAWGKPVLFGPNWTESRDARLLLEAGGAWAASERDPEAAGEKIARRWLEWLEGAERRTAGERAAALVAGGVGAADRTAALVEGLVGSR